MIINGKEIHLTADTTLSRLLESENFSIDKIAVLKNTEIVPKKEFSITTVSDCDVIEVISFVGGG